ncbi:hypothetical protein OAT67_04465 [Bacteriovoracaceae bacterium]|nr:hypothetical protein [Bacteriovoracaceae bacterium]
MGLGHRIKVEITKLTKYKFHFNIRSRKTIVTKMSSDDRVTLKEMISCEERKIKVFENNCSRPGRDRLGKMKADKGVSKKLKALPIG